MVIQAKSSQVRIFLACNFKNFRDDDDMMITIINDNYVIMTIITFVFGTVYYAGTDIEVV